VIEAAVDLLTREGRAAVTTRAVAASAGVQPPAIYRHFADMDALLEAVAEHGYAVFLETKQTAAVDRSDPVEDLRASWDLAVRFGLDNPALFTLMYGEPGRGTNSAAFDAGSQILRDRIQRLAAAGRLRVEEKLAAAIIGATVRGAVLTWLSQDEGDRDDALLHILRESMVTALTTQEAAVAAPTPAAAARALRATLPEQDALTSAERNLLVEWLDRLLTTLRRADR
jgi:AcrR family transcriptional regulator